MVWTRNGVRHLTLLEREEKEYGAALAPKGVRGSFPVSPGFFAVEWGIFNSYSEIEVNILPLFTEIEKNNCFSIYIGSDLNNISEGTH